MRKHVVITAVVGVILGVIATWATVASVAFALGVHSYEAANYSRAASSYSVAARILPGTFGGWKAHMGQGTSQLQIGAIDSGIAELRRALIDVPKSDPKDIEPTEDPEEFTDECVVRYNLGIGLELEGDLYMEANDFAEAELSYRESSAVVEHCVPQSEQHEEQKNNTDQKADQAQQQQSPQDDQNGQGDQGGQDGQDGQDDGSDDGGQGDQNGQDNQDGQDDQGNQGDGSDDGDQDGQDGEGNEGDQTDPWEGHGSAKEQELQERGRDAERRAREQEGREGGYSDWDGQNW